MSNKDEMRRAHSYLLDDLHSHRVDRHSFSIYVGGDPHDEGDWEGGHGQEPGVTHHMADRFEINLALLSRLNPNRPILVELASCGGNWDEGMQIFSAILHCPNPITVLGLKWCRSMTSLIPLAADRFVMRAPAQYMFHHGTNVYAGLAGEELDTFKEQSDAAREMMLAIYVARLREQGAYKRWGTGRLDQMLRAKMRGKIDVWLPTKEAVRWGFADAVYDGNIATLRTRAVNHERRKRMMDVILAG